MECLNCGAALDRSEFCPGCGTNVKIYKKIRHTSNAFYNDGLKRAAVRDLSGAVEALNKSLRFYKGNTDARNLLGLVYYEMGETIDAISEWVISSNFQPEKNPATSYLNQIQNNQARLDAINQTIKKYNQALQYCRQDSRDLATIQLKKVLSLNPKMVKGHQLLALLYMQDGRYDLAKKSLRSAAKIDSNNFTTLRYMKECNRALHGDAASKKKENDDVISYVSGNDTIIRPANLKDNSIVSTVVNILVGLGIGVVVTLFLIVPGVRQAVQSNANVALTEANDSISTKDQTISSLEAQVEELTAEIDSLENSTDSASAQLASYQQFLQAYISYLEGDVDAAGEALGNVTYDHLDETAQEVYDTISASVNEEYLSAAYSAGYSAYNSGNYDEAITNFLKIMELDETYQNGNALYYLAQAYRRNGDNENAITYFQKVISLYPDTERASNAETYIAQLSEDE